MVAYYGCFGRWYRVYPSGVSVDRSADGVAAEATSVDSTAARCCILGYWASYTSSGNLGSIPDFAAGGALGSTPAPHRGHTAASAGYTLAGQQCPSI